MNETAKEAKLTLVKVFESVNQTKWKARFEFSRNRPLIDYDVSTYPNSDLMYIVKQCSGKRVSSSSVIEVLWEAIKAGRYTVELSNRVFHVTVTSAFDGRAATYQIPEARSYVEALNKACIKRYVNKNAAFCPAHGLSAGPIETHPQYGYFAIDGFTIVKVMYSVKVELK